MNSDRRRTEFLPRNVYVGVATIKILRTYALKTAECTKKRIAVQFGDLFLCSTMKRRTPNRNVQQDRRISNSLHARTVSKRMFVNSLHIEI